MKYNPWQEGGEVIKALGITDVTYYQLFLFTHDTLNIRYPKQGQ
jgi:hypothetical protein